MRKQSLFSHPTLALTTAIALVLSATIAAGSLAQEAAEPELTLTKIDVQPPNPGADTLCKLTVTVRNTGERKASQLGFAVHLNGQSLTVYDNQLFMYPVPAGGELEIPLYNFWTTETSRPKMPEDGKLRVEVALNEAQWMDISMEKEMVERAGEEIEEEIEVWTPLGPVERLPTTASVTLAPASE